MKNVTKNNTLKTKIFAAVMAALMIVGAVASTLIFLFQ